MTKKNFWIISFPEIVSVSWYFHICCHKEIEHVLCYLFTKFSYTSLKTSHHHFISVYFKNFINYVYLSHNVHYVINTFLENVNDRVKSSIVLRIVIKIIANDYDTMMTIALNRLNYLSTGMYFFYRHLHLT